MWRACQSGQMVSLLPGQLMNSYRANYAVRNGTDFADLLGQQPPIVEDVEGEDAPTDQQPSSRPR